MTTEERSFERQYKDEQQERRRKRLPTRIQEIASLSENGYTVIKLTDYQFRINGILDLYPTHRRWHDLKTNKRGEYPANKLKDYIKLLIKK